MNRNTVIALTVGGVVMLPYVVNAIVQKLTIAGYCWSESKFLIKDDFCRLADKYVTREKYKNIKVTRCSVKSYRQSEFFLNSQVLVSISTSNLNSLTLTYNACGDRIME